ncbi:MAG: hypothetical protein WCO52_02215 [bacterium]
MNALKAEEGCRWVVIIIGDGREPYCLWRVCIDPSGATTYEALPCAIQPDTKPHPDHPGMKLLMPYIGKDGSAQPSPFGNEERSAVAAIAATLARIAVYRPDLQVTKWLAACMHASRVSDTQLRIADRWPLMALAKRWPVNGDPGYLPYN